MSEHQLPFGVIRIIHGDIAEVIIDEGTIMDAKMVAQYHEFLLNNLTPPFSLLINKVNSYNYIFKSHRELAPLKEINAIALVIYKSSKIATELLASYPRKEKWKFNTFTDCDTALHWLEEEQYPVRGQAKI